MPYAVGPHGELNGSDILLQIEAPAGSGNYIDIGSQRNATFGETTAVIDMSSKESRSQFVNPGRYSSTVTMDAMYIPTGSGYTMLYNAMRNGTYVRVQRKQADVPFERAQCVVADLSQGAPDQDAAIVSISLTVNGGWTPASGV